MGLNGTLNLKFINIYILSILGFGVSGGAVSSRYYVNFILCIDSYDPGLSNYE